MLKSRMEEEKTKKNPIPNHKMKPTKSPPELHFCNRFHLFKVLVQNTVWSKRVIQILSSLTLCHFRESMRFFCDTVIKIYQKEEIIKWPYSMKGDTEKQINSRSPEAKGKCCHFCKFSQVQCTFSSIGQVEGVPKYRCFSYWNHIPGKSYSWKHIFLDIF